MPQQRAPHGCLQPIDRVTAEYPSSAVPQSLHCLTAGYHPQLLNLRVSLLRQTNPQSLFGMPQAAPTPQQWRLECTVVMYAGWHNIFESAEAGGLGRLHPTHPLYPLPACTMGRG